MSNKKSVCAVILAAGSGSRMNCDQTKQTMMILGKSVLRRCVEVFDRCSVISGITVVCKSDEIDFVKKEVDGLNKVNKVVIGGKSRAESAKLGFEAIDQSANTVMIHDACRCLITEWEIEKVAREAITFGAATASVKVADTLKKCSAEGFIESTVSRENLFAAATPQAFSYSLYKAALESKSQIDASITDDNMLVESFGGKIKCVETLPTNIKITVARDIELAEFIIRKRENKL